MPGLTNGDIFAHKGTSLDTATHADYYSKLARLEEVVLAGKHPNYKFPITDVYKLESGTELSPLQELNATTRNPSNVTTNGARLPPSAPIHVRQPAQPLTTPVILAPQSYFVSPSGSSPQLVSQNTNLKCPKDEDPVQAELKSQRQRIEKELMSVQHQLSNLNHICDKEMFTFSGPNQFDMNEVLKKAFAIVPAVVGKNKVDVNDAESTASFGDGYYSSRGNSWSSDKTMLASPTVVPDLSSIAAPPNPPATTQPMLEQPETELRKARVSGLGPKSPVSPESKLGVTQADMQVADASDSSGMAQTEQMDTSPSRDESYSPPAADALGGWVSTSTGSAPMAYVPQSSQFFMTSANTSGMGGRVRESESYSPPPPATPPTVYAAGVVTNPVESMLTSPAVYYNSNTQSGQDGESSTTGKKKFRKAAKVERVDKKRIGKMSKRTEKQAQKQGKLRKTNNASVSAKPPEALHGSSQHDFPNGQPTLPVAAQPTENKRKRRREEDIIEEDPAPYRPFRSATLAISPQQPIKTEPRSPPPLRSGQATDSPRRLVIHEDGRADIEILDTRYAVDHVERSLLPRNAAPQQPRPKYIDTEPIWIDDPEPVPPVLRRSVPDLRRTALQQASRASYMPVVETPPYPEDSFRHVHAPSRLEDLQPLPRALLHHEPRVSRSVSRYALDGQDDSPFEQDDEYAAFRQSIPLSSKRRIFVDEDGNEFFAIPAKPFLRSPVAAEESQYSRPSSSYVQSAYREPLPSSGLGTTLRPRIPEVSKPARALSYALEDSSAFRGGVSAVEPQYRRAQSQALEYQAPIRVQKRTFEMTDDEDDYRRMPPPPPRIGVRQRPREAVEEPVFYPGPGQERRAVSMQPTYPSRARLPPAYAARGVYEVPDDLEYVGTPGVDGRWVRVL